MLNTMFLMVVLFFTVSITYSLINRVEGYEEPKYIEVVVEGGDTVWGLAREFCSKNRDVRKSVYEIGLINNLNSYDIYPGQVIKIPIE